MRDMLAPGRRRADEAALKLKVLCPPSTREDVTRIAELARLELTPDELDLFTRQLGDILTYVEQIRALDTSGVTPTSHVLNRPSSATT